MINRIPFDAMETQRVLFQDLPVVRFNTLFTE